jgi:(p)ppGpp synthase/HD superfamily hydrolase
MKLEDAIEIAAKAHRGQLDKAGQPYILHPLHVMMQCRHNEDVRIVAVLHDVIEDGVQGYRDFIINTGFRQEIIDALDCLTHDKKEDYFDYISRIKTNSLAKEVKLLDLKHNCDLERLQKVTYIDLKRVAKYKKAINILLDIEED